MAGYCLGIVPASLYTANGDGQLCKCSKGPTRDSDSHTSKAGAANTIIYIHSPSRIVSMK